MQHRDTTRKISVDRRLLLGASAAAVLGASRALAQPAPAARPAEPLPGGKKLAQLTAEYVAGFDLKNVPPEVNVHKVAAWAMVSRTILNLDETITKE